MASTTTPGPVPIVFVISPDWTLRAMVRAELGEKGIAALAMETAKELNDAPVFGVAPSVVVVDSVELESGEGREAIQKLPARARIIVVGSRMMPVPELPGAEVLWRPVRIQDIVARVVALAR